MCLCPAAISAFLQVWYRYSFTMCDIEVDVVKFGDVIVEVEELKHQLENLRYFVLI